MKITKEVLILGSGCSPLAATKWLMPIQAAMDQFAINRPSRIAAFLANVGVESGGLTATVENLNYSAETMAKVWPGRYATNPKAKYADRLPNALAMSLNRKPELIANETYCDRNGNGPKESGDGWKYIGRGLIQITGRSKYSAFSKAVGIDVISSPERVEELALAAQSAAWFFSSNGCNEMADRNEISRIIQTINGALPGEANHGTLRITRYNSTRRALI